MPSRFVLLLVTTLCVVTHVRTLCVLGLLGLGWFAGHATQSVAGWRSHAERGNEEMFGLGWFAGHATRSVAGWRSHAERGNEDATRGDEDVWRVA